MGGGSRSASSTSLQRRHEAVYPPLSSVAVGTEAGVDGAQPGPLVSVAASGPEGSPWGALFVFATEGDGKQYVYTCGTPVAD